MRIFLDRFSFIPFLFFITFLFSVPLTKAMEADGLNPLIEDDQSFLSVKANVPHKPQKPPTISEEKRPAVLCSCDGGGARGLFSAKLIELIDLALKKRIQTSYLLNFPLRRISQPVKSCELSFVL